jgi:hypothetical protein
MANINPTAEDGTMRDNEAGLFDQITDCRLSVVGFQLFPLGL